MRVVAPVWSFGPHGEGGARVLQSDCAKARDGEARMTMADAAMAEGNLMPLLLSPVKERHGTRVGGARRRDSVPFAYAKSRPAARRVRPSLRRPQPARRYRSCPVNMSSRGGANTSMTSVSSG